MGSSPKFGEWIAMKGLVVSLLLLYSSGAKARNTGGKVSTNPIPTRTSVNVQAILQLTSLLLHAPCSTPHAHEPHNHGKRRLAAQRAYRCVKLHQAAYALESLGKHREDSQSGAPHARRHERRRRWSVRLFCPLHQNLSYSQMSGAAFVINAPNIPAMPAATNERVNTTISALRRYGRSAISRP